MQIQLYNGAKDNTGSEIEIDAVLYNITDDDALQEQTAKIRKAVAELNHFKTKEGPEYKKLVERQEAYISTLKLKLPAVTWSGTFTKRSIKGIKEYSQLICLDIDKVPEQHFQQIRKQLCDDPHTRICFTSPSGAGIKVIFKVTGNIDQHKDSFLFIEKYFFEKYNLKIDPSGKDVSRLCFICFDLALFINSESLPVSITPPEPLQIAKPFTKKEVTEFEATEDFYSVIHFTDKRLTYTEGSRNNYIFLFACNCNRKGFTEADTIQFSQLHFTDKPANEIASSVKSAYQHHKHEHAKYAKKIKAPGKAITAQPANVHASKDHKQNGTPDIPNTVSAPKTNGTAPTNGHAKDSNGFIPFWKERKFTKGKGENTFEVVHYELQRVEFTDYLFQQGFHLIDTDTKGYQICYSKHGIIEPVDPRIIKRYVFDWCKKNVVRDVEEMLRKGQRQFFAANEMDSLHTKNIEIKTDTETESFFYFKNCWVTVTADNIIAKEYTDLNQYIWAGNKKEHDFHYAEPKFFSVPEWDRAEPKLSTTAMDCEFAKFVYLAAYNPNNPDEKDFEQEIIQQRFECFCSAIGFLLDGYKHPSNRKSIFALDHKIGERNEQHGRTGKSIIPKACERLKVVSHINGKSYDPKYQFRHEPITADAQIIDFNDMTRNFDVENIFEIIADDYNVNRRNNGFLHFKYETSPKVYVSMNAIPRGEGGSYVGRMHIIEFSDYFTPEHTPFVEFGHGLLGSAWDTHEWNRFYNFMLWCVQLYKGSGLLPYPKSNFYERKLKNEVDIEFIDFMNNEDEVPRNRRMDKKPLLDKIRKILADATGGKTLTANSFNRWVKKYCASNGLYFNPHIQKEEKRDLSNNIEYYTIATTPDFKPAPEPGTTTQTTLL